MLQQSLFVFEYTVFYLFLLIKPVYLHLHNSPNIRRGGEGGLYIALHRVPSMSRMIIRFDNLSSFLLIRSPAHWRQLDLVATASGVSRWEWEGNVGGVQIREIDIFYSRTLFQKLMKQAQYFQLRIAASPSKLQWVYY